MNVSEILKKKGSTVFTARADERVLSVLSTLLDRNIGAIVVVSADRRPLGVVSEREILVGLDEHGEDVLKLPSEGVMRRAVRTCRSGDSLHEIMKIMTDYRLRHLPVVDDGKLVGIVSLGDVVKYRLQEMEEEKSILRDSLVARTSL